MGHDLVFERGAHDPKPLEHSGYPWDALLFARSWAFREGSTPHGVVLFLLCGFCALLTGFANNGIVLGTAVVLWVGVFTAHKASDRLTSSYATQGYKIADGVRAASSGGALNNHRHVKRHGSLRDRAA